MTMLMIHPSMHERAMTRMKFGFAHLPGQYPRGAHSNGFFDPLTRPCSPWETGKLVSLW